MFGTPDKADRKTVLLLGAIVALLCGIVVFGGLASQVRQEDGKTFIVDRTGERWDITQAVALGFHPRGFEYGLGRHAFMPLDDSRLRTPPAGVRHNLRVLGIKDGTEAQAYSVPRLMGHEIANSRIGGKAIAVAY